ncbi:MAG: diguanylate cyclase [Gammaproteobacteria bacterium]
MESGVTARRNIHMSNNDERAATICSTTAMIVHRERLLDTIASIGKVITVSSNLQSVMDVVAEECARLTRADGATIFMVENNRLSAKAAVGMLGFSMLEIPIGNSSLPSNAVKLRHVVRCADSETDDRTLRRVSSRTGTRSSVSAPFTFDDKQEIAGVLHVASMSQNAFTDEDAEIIQIFANVVGSAIQNARQYDQAMREGREDALTGLLNRRAFEDHVRMLKKEQLNHGQQYSLILFDVDRLKQINDEYGHTAGDNVLKTIASCAKKQVRKSDIVYRLGGDEFAVLQPQTTLDVALLTAERIEKAISKKSIRDMQISVSTGACEAASNESIPLLMTRTDQLLYKTKHVRHLRLGSDGHEHHMTQQP